MKKEIFREYDIRGIVGKDLNPDVAELIGKGYGIYVRRNGKKKVSVGRDVRVSSDELFHALVSGIVSTGIDIIDLGICPTPLVYFSLFNLDVDGGIMITGSHNPPEFNGFKICLGRETIYGDEIQRLRMLIESGEFEKGKGRLSRHDIISDYKKYINKRFSNGDDGRRRLKVAIDSGNGTAGLIAPGLFKGFGHEVIELFSEPDGRFPNHHPDPTITSNLEPLIDKVRKERADVGIAFDGDADRIGVVDDQGDIIWGDKLMIIFAQDILSRKAGATIISEVKASSLLYKEIERLGGRPIMWKTGHSLIKAKIKETGALLAGEMSGHIFFADDYFGYDDAIYAACRLIEIMTKRREKVSAMLSHLPKVCSTPEIRIDCPDEIKFTLVESLKRRLENKFKVIDIDGVRIEFEDGWGLVRASNTQPVIVMRFEANSQERLEEIRSLMEEELKEARREA
ncbi:MAG: phosphomannomutase/phosphoglucomutase [Nitrospirae bacterium]|nr:phosphomannomutase/phosphoglucomutase [Nitrospirota bacterium]